MTNRYSQIKWVLFRIARTLKGAVGSGRPLDLAALPRFADGKILIHLGCGKIDSPGFINVDARPAPHVHVAADVTDLSMFPADFADMVYACHLLEHIPINRLREVLWEWRRVVRPGGMLRLSVPDFDKLIDIYARCGGDIEVIARRLMGGQHHKYNFHCAVFNRRYLESLLTEAGFVRVEQWDPATAPYHGFRDHASRTVKKDGQAYPVSLNLQAIK